MASQTRLGNDAERLTADADFRIEHAAPDVHTLCMHGRHPGLHALWDRNHLFDSTLAAAIHYAATAFATGLPFFAAALRTAAHLFLVAAMIALRPPALSFRLGFAGAALAFLTGRLGDIWNRIPGLTPVQRFTNRVVAAARIWSGARIRRGRPLNG